MYLKRLGILMAPPPYPIKRQKSYPDQVEKKTEIAPRSPWRFRCCRPLLTPNASHLRSQMVSQIGSVPPCGGFLKWCVSPPHGFFPTKNDHFGVEIGEKPYHLRKHNNGGLVQMIFLYNWVIFRWTMLIFRGKRSEKMKKQTPPPIVAVSFIFNAKCNHLSTYPPSSPERGPLRSGLSEHHWFPFKKKMAIKQPIVLVVGSQPIFGSKYAQ